ncbi:MAG: four-carbon acid sugar kinase family protein [Desulfitobacteriaceae bacterium]|nr:four-carbon acid sugar kinase family protein [Desulfitobacteriaceae bacterium]
MHSIAIIADDLTGASDTGIQFRKHGLTTKVVVDADKLELFLENNEVLAINSNTRPLKNKNAYRKVYEISCTLKKAGFKSVYKKIDSTFRGNLGSELEAVMDAFDAGLTILVPSYPDNGRCMVNGNLKISLPCDEEIKDNEEIDVRYDLCYVPSILQKEMKRKVALIDLKTVNKGSESIYYDIIKFKKEGFQVIVIDAVTNEDLNKIAIACKNLPQNTVFSGTAGFAAYLPKVIDLCLENQTYQLKKDKVLLIVAGTYNHITRMQIDKVLSNTNSALIKVDTNKIINGKLFEEVQKTIKDAMELYNTQKEISSPLIIAVDTLFESPDKMNLLTSKFSRDVAMAIGDIVKGLVDKDIIESLLITGGDTALHVLSALNAEGIDLQEEVLAGIPLGLLSGGKAHNVRIVTKAGGFGAPTAILEVMKHLETLREKQKELSIM